MLVAATDAGLAALEEVAGRDWSRPAHGLDWTCRQTLDHLALGLTGYAGLLIARPTDRYITLFASLDPQAPVRDCLDGLRIAATLAASTVRDTDPDVRAWHPWGTSDATGFAAMAITELALHTYDITRALGVPRTPSDTAAAAVLARLFPDAPSGHRPSDTLLWCTGRAALPGLPRRVEWQWDGTVR
ncbi:maleylpyruvate isomerase N-terminal domain-containing protein [Streptomyces sp. SID14515]|uniref:maleylpyruvate isomerase N-terminal domain-containing protein n=1 Tax=Streptomyces sp. SID14515 TaxID=2706074 RepID=UPI001EF2200E|nr:maleylpyruvate isomerase N-terminal domain-containing protein [Streptomyces sp. SID14515]